MQEPRQATAATQPYPIGDAIVPQSIDIPPEGSSVIPSGAAVINDGKIFTPFWTDPIAMKPGTMGGANWPPSSYDPETHLLYVCASDRINSFSVDAELDAPVANQVYMGGRFTQAQADDRGILAALDVTTNKLAWRQAVARDLLQRLDYVTAGGLLFVGRNDGRLTALDKAQRQAAVGVHDGRRRQYDRDHVRAQRRAARRRARGRRRVRGRHARRRHLDVLAVRHDEVVARDARGFGGGGGGRRRRRRPAAGAGRRTGPSTSQHGRQIYAEACVACHGEAGDGGHGGGPTLVAGLPPRRSCGLASAGRNTMPASGACTPRPTARTSRATSSTFSRSRLKPSPSLASCYHASRTGGARSSCKRGSMAVDFRGHPMFAPGFNSPTRFEADVYDCEVWGQIPTDIEGTFYRVQCDFQYRPPRTSGRRVSTATATSARFVSRTAPSISSRAT